MAGKNAKSGWVGLLIGGGMWIFLGLAPLWSGWSDVRLAFGLAGQPGTVVVEECVPVGSGKNRGTDCRGLFTPDDPGAAPSRVQLPPESEEGEEFPARLNPDDGWAHPTGTAGRFASLALPAFGLLVLSPVPLTLVFLFKGGKGPGKVLVRATAVFAAAAGLLCVAGMIGAG